MYSSFRNTCLEESHDWGTRDGPGRKGLAKVVSGHLGWLYLDEAVLAEMKCHIFVFHQLYWQEIEGLMDPFHKLSIFRKSPYQKIRVWGIRFTMQAYLDYEGSFYVSWSESTLWKTRHFLGAISVGFWWSGVFHSCWQCWWLTVVCSCMVNSLDYGGWFLSKKFPWLPCISTSSTRGQIEDNIVLQIYKLTVMVSVFHSGSLYNIASKRPMKQWGTRSNI